MAVTLQKHVTTGNIVQVGSHVHALFVLPKIPALQIALLGKKNRHRACKCNSP